MCRKSLVVRTKLTPPRLHKRILHRPRLTHLLLEALDYRLTIVRAGAGYGKSTALAALVESGHPSSGTTLVERMLTQWSFSFTSSTASALPCRACPRLL